AVEPLGDSGELEAQADAGREHHQPVARREVIEPLPQRADRLRGIVAVSARSLAAICVLERVAKLGHTLLDANGHGQMYHCREARPTRAPCTPPEQGRGG